MFFNHEFRKGIFFLQPIFEKARTFQKLNTGLTKIVLCSYTLLFAFLSHIAPPVPENSTGT